MRLLAIETATDACSCALLDGEVLTERFELAPRRHAELLLGMVADLFASAGLRPPELDAIAFGRGPGSFTGVRIATGVAQGLGFAADVPLVGVSSLQVLAQSAAREQGWSRLLAAFDARMDEVYWGAFEVDDRGLVVPSGREQVCPPDQVPIPVDAGWLGVGEGWSAYASALHARLGDRVERVESSVRPRAGDLARLGAAAFDDGKSCSAELARPVYLRDQVARPRRA